MRKDEVVALVERLAEPICRAHGVELVQVSCAHGGGRTVVRVLIDRERSDGLPGSGVSFADCTAVTHDLSALLDAHDAEMPEAYDLEVGSPGLERPLVKPADYERFAGRQIQLRTREPMEGRRRFRGKLLGLQDGLVCLQDEQQRRRWSIPLSMVQEARLLVRF